MGSGGKGGGQQATDYRMAVHGGICTGPVDAVTGIYVDGHTAWEGEVTALTPPEYTKLTIGRFTTDGVSMSVATAAAPGTTSISINKPSIFGGPTSGGGLVGTVEMMFGGPTQLAPPVLATKLGGTQATVPGFRGFLSLLFHDTLHGGFLWTTNNPVIAQNVDVHLRRMPVTPALDPTVARIPDAQDVGYGAGIGTSASETATHIANSINASSQYFTAVASGAVVTITEVNLGTQWINAVSPVADTAYPFRASVITPGSTTSFTYYFHVTSFGTPPDTSGTSGVQNGPAPGVATLTIEQPPITGMTVSLGPETFTFSSYAGDDANPAHIIYEVLTNTDWGGTGCPPSMIDTSSFRYAASVLFAESLGLSMMWAQQSSSEDFINEVLNHINATLFINPQTGLWTIKLLRGDFDVSTLPVYTPDNAVMKSFQRRTWSETINEIIVQWTNPITEQTETIGAQNLANIAIQGGIVSDTRNYYGVRNAPLAAQLAAREVRGVSAPLCSMDMEVDRSAWAQIPGGVVVVNWPENNLSNLVMRVGKIDYGSPDDPAVKISLVQDIFGLSRTTIPSSPQTLWIDPSSIPEDMQTYQILTLPYYFSTSNSLTGSTANLVYPEVQVAVLAYDINRDVRGFDLFGQVALPDGTQTWANLGRKNVCEWASSAVMVAEATSTIPVSLFKAPDRAPVVGGFILIGTGDATQEIALVTASDGTNYTVNRGALDTVPQAWPAGTPLWSIKPGNSIIDTSSTYSAGQSLSYKFLERTSQGTLPLANATPRTVTLTPRYYQPLRPANVKVNGVGFGPVAIGSASTIVVSWATRNRTLEQGTSLAWTAGSVAPEYNQETVISVYDQSNNLVYQQQGSLWTDTSVTLQTSWFARYTSITIVVSSQLNGNTRSLQGYGLKVTGLPGTSGAALPPSPPAATAPPSPVTAPANANWTVTGTSVAGASGDTVPAIVVSGIEESISDQDLVIRYRVVGSSIWSVAPLVPLTPAAVTTKITGLAAATQYDVQLAYQESYGTSGNILSTWLTPSSSPVTTGSSTVANQGPLATSSDFASVTGATKPANNATVGAPAGTTVAGRAAADVASTVQSGGGVAANQVITASVVSGAISNTSSYSVAGPISITPDSLWHTIASLTLTPSSSTSSLIVFIHFQHNAYHNSGGSGPAVADSVNYRVNAGSTNSLGGGTRPAQIAGNYSDFSTSGVISGFSGSTTFNLQVQSGSSETDFSFQAINFIIMELKK